MAEYSKGSHTVFHHRYHLVWITKYRYWVLQGDLRLRVRAIIAQVAEELDFGHFSCEADQNPSWFNWVTPELEHVT